MNNNRHALTNQKAFTLTSVRYYCVRVLWFSQQNRKYRRTRIQINYSTLKVRWCAIKCLRGVKKKEKKSRGSDSGT